MLEFSQTENARLTSGDFKAINSSGWVQSSEGGMDPPSFIKSLRKDQKAIKVAAETLKEISNEKIPDNFVDTYP